MRCQTEGTERVAAGAGGGASWGVQGRTTESERVTAEGVAGGPGVTHDDISVPVTIALGLTLTLTLTVELFALPVDEHLAFPVACEVAIPIAAEGGETERLWCASAFVGVEFCAEDAEVLFVLLADFAMCCLELVEGLADDVEFVDLAGDWEGVLSRVDKGRQGGRTLSLVLVPLAPEVVALLLEVLELVADGVEGLGDDGEGVGALGACACGLEVFVLCGGQRGARTGTGVRTLYIAEAMGGGGGGWEEKADGAGAHGRRLKVLLPFPRGPALPSISDQPPTPTTRARRLPHSPPDSDLIVARPPARERLRRTGGAPPSEPMGTLGCPVAHGPPVDRSNESTAVRTSMMGAARDRR